MLLNLNNNNFCVGQRQWCCDLIVKHITRIQRTHIQTFQIFVNNAINFTSTWKAMANNVILTESGDSVMCAL